MKTSSTQGKRVYSITDLSEVELLVILMALGEFYRPFGVKNGYQEQAAKISSMLLREHPEFKGITWGFPV